MKKCLLVVAAMVSVLRATPPSDTCKQETWVTSDEVWAIVPVGDIIYIAGEFTRVGPYTGAGAVIDSATGEHMSAFPLIDGRVLAACPDGDGGWFVGGTFSSVGGQSRNRIAALDASTGSATAWNPDADGGCPRYRGERHDGICGRRFHEHWRSEQKQYRRAERRNRTGHRMES